MTEPDTTNELDELRKEIHKHLVEIGDMYPADSMDIRYALDEIMTLITKEKDKARATDARYFYQLPDELLRKELLAHIKELDRLDSIKRRIEE